MQMTKKHEHPAPIGLENTPEIAWMKILVTAAKCVLVAFFLGPLDARC
jgi:hypothetical protein